MTNMRLCRMSGTKRTASGLPINTAGNLGRLRGSIELKGHEQLITANPCLLDPVVFRIGPDECREVPHSFKIFGVARCYGSVMQRAELGDSSGYQDALLR